MSADRVTYATSTDIATVLAAIAALPTSPIKSIQKGVLSTTFSGSAYSVTVNSVNPAKCMLLLTGDTALDSKYGSNTLRTVLYAKVSNATTISFTAQGSSSSYNVSYKTMWQLIEFN